MVKAGYVLVIFKSILVWYTIIEQHRCKGCVQALCSTQDCDFDGAD